MVPTTWCCCEDLLSMCKMHIVVPAYDNMQCMLAIAIIIILASFLSF